MLSTLNDGIWDWISWLCVLFSWFWIAFHFLIEFCNNGIKGNCALFFLGISLNRVFSLGRVDVSYIRLDQRTFVVPFRPQNIWPTIWIWRTIRSLVDAFSKVWLCFCLCRHGKHSSRGKMWMLNLYYFAFSKPHFSHHTTPRGEDRDPRLRWKWLLFHARAELSLLDSLCSANS